MVILLVTTGTEKRKGVPDEVGRGCNSSDHGELHSSVLSFGLYYLLPGLYLGSVNQAATT